MKRLIAILLAALLVFGLVACGNGNGDDDPTPTPVPDVETPTPDVDIDVDVDDNLADHIRVALVAHSPDSILDDGSFNEGAWQGVTRFLGAHGQPMSHAEFFQPHEASDEARVDLISDAIIEWGANIVVMPGFHFANSSAVVQEMFPEVSFVLLDATPEGGPEANTAAIHYAEEQAGFLAGYAVVMDGHRSLGFMGGIAVPAVVRFGHGFLQGAEYAANELGLDEGEVTVRYTYLGNFAPSPEHVTMAAAWFAGGVDVIFAAAGGATFSVISAANDADALVVGVDVDQSGQGPSVITSAMKELGGSVYDMLTDFMNGTFSGGVLRFDASNNGVGLPMANSRFENFTQAQYDAIFALLANGTIVVNNDLGDMPSDVDLDLHLIAVTEL
ncbi:MAG: BMP family ABC transporter substrate-binding protein [Oscillospiraceae bacterium]|nr:BMP family ABC transporter substrate-binding protein [Oscillospiraceae bacterium]